MVYFDDEAITMLTRHIEGYKKENKSVFVLCDTHTEKVCLPVLRDYVSFPFIDEVITMPFGEENKHIETVIYLWQRLLDRYADRNSMLICLGGGVVCDVGGFVAGTFKRGIDYVYLPTSLMAQIDAGIGGKTAINLNHVKNVVGLFSQPNHVFIIPFFLRTLPEKEILSGFAEMLKHGLIADKTYWNELTQIDDVSRIISPAFIKRSVEIKTAICNSDPYDVGERRMLNFGHTIGHAVESVALSSDSPLSHGEAVAVGMMAETHISLQKTMINKDEYLSVVRLLRKFFPPFPIQKYDCAAMLSALQNDKKKMNNKLNVTLLNAIGKATINQEVSQDEVIIAWEKTIKFS
jgi:3-dehydroquinate synthase